MKYEVKDKDLSILVEIGKIAQLCVDNSSKCNWCRDTEEWPSDIFGNVSFGSSIFKWQPKVVSVLPGNNGNDILILILTWQMTVFLVWNEIAWTVQLESI